MTHHHLDAMKTRIRLQVDTNHLVRLHLLLAGMTMTILPHRENTMMTMVDRNVDMKQVDAHLLLRLVMAADTIMTDDGPRLHLLHMV